MKATTSLRGTDRKAAPRERGCFQTASVGAGPPNIGRKELLTLPLTAIEIEEAWREQVDPLAPPQCMDEGVLSRVCAQMPGVTGDVLDWFIRALADDSRKWFAAAVLTRRPEGATPLLEHLLRAAMVEPDPSFNRFFIRPLKAAGVSWHDVVEPLLRLAGSDDPMIRGGLSRAGYWLGAELGPAPRDVHRRLNTQQIRAFIAATDTYEVRSLVRGLRLDRESVDPEHHHLIAEVVAKARAHDDAFVRHRIEVELGSDGPFQPLTRS
jgi:hypothetical protein